MIGAVQRYFYAKDLPLCEDVVSVVLGALAQLYQDYDPAIYDAEAYLRDRNWGRWLERYMWSPRERDRVILYYQRINEHRLACDIRRLLYRGPYDIAERLTTTTVNFLQGGLTREKYAAGLSRWLASQYSGKLELGRLRALLSEITHPTPRAKVQAAIDVIEYVEAKKIGK